MGDSIGSRLKAAAVVFVLIAMFSMAYIGIQPEKADARANLTAYLSVPPNGWEPMGYNVNGSAPWLVVNTVGWNAVKLMGNVGLGDGSVNFLNATSNRDINYTDSYIMAADISTAPMDMGRLSNFQNAPGDNGTATAGTGVALNDPYHTILIGRPVDDMMYQYPLTPAVSAYGRLAGLPMPDGSLANIGIRSLSYGY
jgi:hypothetical protein